VLRAGRRFFAEGESKRKVFMHVSRLLLSVYICVFSAFSSLASAFPREKASQDKTAGAAGQQTSPAVVTVPGANSARTGDVRTPSFQLVVKWQSGKLSLDAEAVPRSEVLQAISRETGIEVTGAEGLSNLVSMHLAGVALFQALRDLLVHVDYAITPGPQGSTPPRGTRVIIVGRSSPDSSSPALVADSETNASATQAAIQPADNTPADAAPQATMVASIQTEDTGEDRQTVKQAPQQQLANQFVESDQGAVGLEPLSESLPGTSPLLDDTQTVKLAAVETAAASQDREALGKYMQDANAAVQAAAFNALAAHDNPAAVENLLAEITDPSQPVRLQALQVLSQSPQADEQTVMTTLIDALNGADSSFSAYAAKALAQRGTPEAMNALSEVLNSSDTSTRLMVLQTVDGTEAGLPLLRAALSNSNETVRSTAAALLQQVEATTGP
jgi:HEAT repeat protein